MDHDLPPRVFFARVLSFASSAVTRRSSSMSPSESRSDSISRAIDAATTMQTIDWIDQVAAAILVVIDQG